MLKPPTKSGTSSVEFLKPHAALYIVAHTKRLLKWMTPPRGVESRITKYLQVLIFFSGKKMKSSRAMHTVFY